MTYIKLLTVLTTLALLTACGGGGGTAETKTDDKGEGTSVCTTNAFHADCGTEFETQRQTIISECIDDESGELCTDATTFACTDNFFHELCNDIKEYEDKRTEFNNTCTNTKSQTVCDMEALVRNCAANPFMNTCLMDTGAIALRESRCLANIQIDDSCRGEDGIATVFCKANPFDTATPCMADTYFPLRVADCITDGNAGITRCNNLFTASASNTCLTNPFTDACTSNMDFGTYANTARVNRVAFCGISGNAGNVLCSAGSGYADCVANPFATECGTYFEFAEESYCTTNDVTACPNVTYADWVAGFDTPLNTAGDNTRTETIEFLQGTENGLDIGNTKLAMRDPTVRKLNLETAIYKSVALGGEAKNGVAWFDSRSGAGGDADPRRFYSGIFSGTDLGAPLVSADASVSVPWKGSIGWTVFFSFSAGQLDISLKDFELTVDFANSEIRAFVQELTTDHFLLKAEFDDTGRFNGTIIYGTFAGNDKTATPTNVTNGVLTGIIGKQGAVGAFISNQADIATTDKAFVGGFGVVHPTITARVEAAEQARLAEVERLRLERERIARELLESQVTYTDWIGGFGVSPPPATPSTTPTNQFLAGTTTLDPLTSATPTLLTNTMGGVGFFIENGASYAGLLSNTNLGLPVPMMPQVDNADVTAVWPGMIQGVGVFLPESANSSEILTPISFNLNVNFTTRKLTGQAVNPQYASRRINIFGDFLESDNGVITGRVETRVQTSPLFLRIGNLTGIIGQDGAVGAFVYTSGTNGTNNPLPFAGGFYAAPTQ